jgi:hypothetical protein
MQKLLEDFKNFGKDAGGHVLATMTKAYDALEDLSKRTAQNMQQSFSDGFFKVFKGEFKSLGDVVTSFCDSMLRSFSDVIAKMIVQSMGIETMFSGSANSSGGMGGLIGGLMGGIGMLFGGPPGAAIGAGAGAGTAGFADWLGGSAGSFFGHDGGRVTLSGIKRYHSGGLAGDEVPAILQTGERVLNRKETKAYDSGGDGQGGNVYHITINAVDAQSFASLVRRNPESIIAVVGENMSQNGALRRISKATA